MKTKAYSLPARADCASLVTVPVRRGLGLVDPLLKIVNGRGWIAGGFARWCCSPATEPAPAADIDVFFGDDDDVVCVQEKLMVLGAKVVKDVSYFVQLDVTDAFPGFGLQAVQLVNPRVSYDGSRAWGPTKEDVVRQIDITVCRIALDGHGRTTATADSQFLADEAEKRICFKRIKDPLSEMRHAFKYAAKGYSLSTPDATELLEDWAKRDPVERSVNVHGGGERDGY